MASEQIKRRKKTSGSKASGAAKRTAGSGRKASGAAVSGKRKNVRRRKHRRLNPVLRRMIAPLLLIVLVIMTVQFFRKTVTLEIRGDNPAYAEAGTYYEDAGAYAYEHRRLFNLSKEEVKIDTVSNVNTAETGEYSVEYSYTYKNQIYTEVRKVIVQDTQPPVITLTESEDYYTLPNAEYVEEGVRAIDIYDGDISDQIVSEIKDGVVYYSITDRAGNTATAERTIVYDDRKAPVITLEGGDELVWYTENGEYPDNFTAVDDLDGDVTGSVVVNGSVDVSTPGDYTLNYSVTDSYGNTAEASRIVHVSSTPQNSPGGTEDAYTIYLTFDDGPGPYTNELLDILKKYNVKATFFTTSCYGYSDCIAREASEGHTVAVHTYTHKYDEVYASTDAYWNDFNKQNAVVQAQTGSYTTLFRFPGGSSNTVSANYCSGVVSAVAEQAAAKGYEYFDWNVSSGDAGGTTDTEQVYQNVIAGVQKNTQWGVPSVVLQHDIKDFSVAAVEKIIKWGLENGYHFEALSSGCYHAKHSIYN